MSQSTEREEKLVRIWGKPCKNIALRTEDGSKRSRMERPWSICRIEGNKEERTSKILSVLVAEAL